MKVSPKSYSKRDVVKLVVEMAESHGGQGTLAKALGFNATAISRAVAGSLTVALTDALGLVFDDARGRYVQVREPTFVTAVDALGALTAELADVKLSLKVANMANARLREEVACLKSRLAGNDRVAA